jgi:hypothetical protein
MRSGNTTPPRISNGISSRVFDMAKRKQLMFFEFENRGTHWWVARVRKKVPPGI